MTREQASREIDSLDFYMQNHTDDYGEESHTAMMMAKDALSSSENPKMGHWEWNQYDANPEIGNFHCSLCHSIGKAYYDYCPGCGARMEVIPNETDY